MNKNNKMKDAKDTIRRWLNSQDYPPEFLRFFFKWTLLNLFYNAVSTEKDEVKRVLEFGRKNEKLLNAAILSHATKLVENECVGSGKGETAPNSWVKTASIKLRDILSLDKKKICAACRTGKRVECQAINLENYSFSPFEAILRNPYH